jgi:hypothetical protein
MKIINNLTQSRKFFFQCIEICNSKYRQGDDLGFYRELVAQHREIADLNKLIASEAFLQKLYATLEKWDMNKRGARLLDFPTMRDSIRSYRENLSKLYKYRLQMLSDNDIQKVQQQLKVLFCGLKIMLTKRRIVGVSKALHFLLPDLALPIDSSNTMLAFYGYNRYEIGEEKEFKTYSDIFVKSYKIAKHLNLTESDADGCGWNCSVPKLIDNAIIGFFIKAKELMKKDFAGQLGT